MNEAIIETATKNTVESEAEAKDENKGSAFIRTSKILFESNNTNQVKLDELSNFLDLCSNALNFYVIYFARYHQLDKLLFVPAKHKNNKIFASTKQSCSNLTKLNNIFYDLVYDKEKNKYKFNLKLKFYPDEILKANASPSPVNNAETIFAESDDSDDSLDQKFRSILSARTLKSVKTQAMGIIRSWVQQILQSYQFGYFNRDKYKKSHRKNIRKYCDDKRKVVKNLIRGAGKKDSKLNIDKFEFNSVNCQLLRAGIDDSFELSKNSELSFDLLFSLHSMYTKEYSKQNYHDRKNKLHIPLSSHKHFNELKSGIVANTQCKHEEIAKSFLVSKDGIEVRFKLKSISKESQLKSNLVGIDQGQRKLFSAIYVNENLNNKDINCCYLTEENLQEQLHSYAHTYNEVCDKIAIRQKGSKGFKRAQEHRKNLINQAVNILAQIFNFEDDVAEIRLEKLRRLGEGKKKSRKLQAFNYADLRHKIERKCQETNVRLIETSNAYRSQRCSLCGFVHKKNRLNGGEEFKCLKCGYTADADINSAKNQVANLPPIYVNRQNRNKASPSRPNHTTGFYWLCESNGTGEDR